MTLQIHNTLTRRKEAFAPLDPKNLRLYVCGPTVYDFAHIGNARPVVVFDVLFRLLRQLYGADHVTYARNITDVEDKIIVAARESGETIEAVTARTTEAYHRDMAALGALPPSVEPRATEHIPQMIAMIEVLIAKGHAYAAEGHVLFNVPSMADYGRLSGRDREEMVAGARVEVAPYKKDPADFVLWKPSTPEQPGWDSPWGRGRPGWHIECSAMSEAHLGQVFDIHGGGQDLIFPHHENEIAQSRCAHGTALMARYWMHNGYVVVGGKKMSKSLGNFFTVRELLEEGFPGEAIRLTLLSGHYRQPLDVTREKIAEAKARLDRLYRARGLVERLDFPDPMEVNMFDDKLLESLEDDLNTPRALSVLDAQAASIFESGEEERRAHKSSYILNANLLGLLPLGSRQWFAQGTEAAEEAEILRLIEARNQARKAKDFAEADRIRDDLAAQGVLLEDGPEGTTWKRA